MRNALSSPRCEAAAFACGYSPNRRGKRDMKQGEYESIEDSLKGDETSVKEENKNKEIT